jgi:hypothetical protein
MVSKCVVDSFNVYAFCSPSRPWADRTTWNRRCRMSQVLRRPQVLPSVQCRNFLGPSVGAGVCESSAGRVPVGIDMVGTLKSTSLRLNLWWLKWNSADANECSKRLPNFFTVFFLVQSLKWAVQTVLTGTNLYMCCLGSVDFDLIF